MLVKRAAALERIDNIDLLWQGIVETLNAAGFDHIIYHSVNADFAEPLLRCTIDGLYDGTDPSDDPFLIYACNKYDIVPIGTEFVAGHPYITDRERDLVERAGAAGFLSGLGIPMRLQGSERFGGFIIGTGVDGATFRARFLPRAEEIRLFCLLIHRHIETLLCTEASALKTSDDDFRTPLLAPELPEIFDTLSPREREVVYLLAHGSSRQESADICGISVHTVSDYAKSAYRKLNVSNRGQAAALIHNSQP